MLKHLSFAVIAASVFFGAAFAKVIRVPGNYKTISDALGNADSGDTVLVKRGVYDENVTLVMGVVLKGEDPLTTIIDGGRRGPTVMGVTESEISHFTIRNGLEGVLCENTIVMIFHENIVNRHNVGRTLQCKPGKAVAEHHVLLYFGI